MVARRLSAGLRKLLGQYPVVTLTGPRQSGKTTLCRQTAPHLPYVNLEAGDVRDFALRDPRGFLAQFQDGAVLDEVQRAPELLSYIQVIVDEQRRNGRFLLTGSSQLLLDERTTQSLAGRTALLTLLPLSIDEVRAFGRNPSTNDLLHTGFYPRIYDQHIEPTRALGDYVETYVERDVRQLMQVRDLTTFRRFIGLCAGRVGRLLNLSSLANDTGISHTTAREWISLLEASYVVFRLPPFFTNVGKRLMKSPKLYFHDVGLASYLCGIEHAGQLATHPLRGVFFENMVVVEALKHRTNTARRSNLFFYRDSSGFEIDLLAVSGDGVVAVEIKAGATMTARFFDGLRKFAKLVPETVRARLLVYDGEPVAEREGVEVVRAEGLAAALTRLDSCAGH